MLKMKLNFVFTRAVLFELVFEKKMYFLLLRTLFDQV